MRIQSVSIRNFRGIGNSTPPFDCKNLNLIIGDNGTSKTSVLEAINLCLSSSYAASKLSIKDFYLGNDQPIEIIVTFDEHLNVEIPDYFGNKQKIACDGILLTAKKRDRAAPKRAFNDLVVTEHYYVPVEDRSDSGWTITRGSGNPFKITERQLALTYASAEYPRSFYFGKNRDRQLQKGYNSSISNVVDDLNWRFEKNQRSKDESGKFKSKREEIEKYVFDNTDGDTLNKTIKRTNSKLFAFNLPAIDLSLIKTLTPYDNSEIVKRFDGFELPVNLTGSGIEMITALIFLETLADISKEEICIIIDEPELHLHPTLQDAFASHLHSISSKTQVFVSTHSPFFFKNSFKLPNTNLLISELLSGHVIVTNARAKGFGSLKWSPSWGEICYLAYNLPTVEFHDDLYSTIEDRLKTTPFDKISQEDVESWLQAQGQMKEVQWSDTSGNVRNETLMTYIRNRIHHPDNQNRPTYNNNELRDSIERMLLLIR